MIALVTPSPFGSIGAFYKNFDQTQEVEVIELLRRSQDLFVQGVEIPVEGRTVHLKGDLVLPCPSPRALVLFAHGSGSSRHSPRNQMVAQVLQKAGVGTLLMDLLTAHEKGNRQLVFDIRRLAGRLLDAAIWSHEHHPKLLLGFFGASTGGAALVAAAHTQIQSHLCAIVSREEPALILQGWKYLR